MTPFTLLSLWRMRWGKTNVTALAQPLITGRLSALGDSLADSWLWRVPGFNFLTVVLWGAVLFLLTPVHLTSIHQLALSLVLLLPALLLRCYKGPWITLMLLGLALISTSRYLYWRMSQSLGTDGIDAVIFIALGILVAEVLYIARVALCIANRLVPLAEPSSALPDAVADWPTVGIFVVCTGQRLTRIEATLRAATDIAWPRLKITLYFIDAVARDGVRKFLNANNTVYLVYPEPTDHAQTSSNGYMKGVVKSAVTTENATAMLNRVLSDAKEDLCVLLNIGDVPTKHCLTDTLGWFWRDPTLGLVCTPGHFLTPPFSLSLTGRVEATAPSDGSWMVLRRNMLLSLGGLPDGPVTSQHHIAQVMHQAGLKHAFVVSSAHLPSSGLPPCILPSRTATTPPSESWYRLNTPFGRYSWWWRCRIHHLKTALDACLPLLHLVFWVTPMVFLLTGLLPVQAPIAALLPYAVPHLLQGWLLYQRLHTPVHLTLWLELQEAFWALYLLVLTTVTVTVTKVGRMVNAWKTHTPPVQGQVAWPMSTLDTLLMAGWGLSIIVGITLLQPSDMPLLINTLFYGAWCGMGLMLVAAKLAVAEEEQDQRLHRQIRMQMPAMLKLPNNRTVACNTTNFPQPHLQLAVPTALPLRTGDAVNISLFNGFDEVIFAGQVQSAEDRAVYVTIDPSGGAEYAALADAVAARGHDGPPWLPDSDADQIIPDCVTDALQWPLLAWMRLWASLIQKQPSATHQPKPAAPPLSSTPKL